MNQFLKNNWPHFAVLAAFVVLMFAYFSPEFDGHNIKQHDVQQFKGMAQETVAFRERTGGEEPLWTNSMFGGMPTTQISILYTGNIFQRSLIGLQNTIGVPSAIFLMHLIGFYILALCLGLRPLVGFIGAVAFGLASYEIVILQAGHNSKAMTVALMAPVLGAFIMAYRTNWKWGALLSGLFMSFQLASNHLQVTYYFAFLLFGLGVYELIRAIRSSELKKFAITSASVLAAYLLAVGINYGNISLTNEYAKHTIRGGNDVTIQADGQEAVKNTTGLDKEYITNWSYGIGESFTLVSPYVKGSHSTMIADSRFRELVENSDRSSAEIKKIMEAPFGLYWGDQPMTSGPVYVGVVMLFLFALAMYFVKSPVKWVYLAVSILALALSWGKNFMGLTDFFIEYLPGYNKFRTVTIILVLIELCVPLMAVLLLERLYREREAILDAKKPFLAISGAFIGFLLILRVVGLGDNFTTRDEADRMADLTAQVEQQILGMDPAFFLQNYQIDVTDPAQFKQIVDAQVDGSMEQYELIKEVRRDVFNASMNRSILFAVLIFGVLALYFFTSIPVVAVMILTAGLVLVDMIPVDQNYLSAETRENGQYKFWLPEAQMKYPFSPEGTDLQLLEAEMAKDASVRKAVEEAERNGVNKADELGYTGADRRRVMDAYRFSGLNFATNYRVFDYNGGWSSSRASYFHKSLGGYHGAKLRNIQNLFDFHIQYSNNAVLDMMNVRYLIQKEDLRLNPTALGNAWLVKQILPKETPNDEIRALGKEFKLENTGAGKMLINGQEMKNASIYGAEKLAYVMAEKDTLKIPLANGVRKGDQILWVMDANGRTDLIPAFTLANDSLSSFTKLVAMEVTSDFKPADEAVLLNSEAAKLKNTKFSGEGTVRMTSYAPNKITYEAECKGDQFAVFSEVYYPIGWTATVDGKEVDIVKTNYLLRGLPLTGGKHKVEFVFGSEKLRKANLVSVAGSIIFGLLLAFGIYTERKKKTTKV
jgi:hypothetical protein